MIVARWLLAVLGMTACGPAIPPLPSQGGPAWSEIKSEHFTLWTDAPVAQGHLLVRKMEHHRQVILRAMNDAPSVAHAFVIALRTTREVGVYLPNDVVASAWPAGGVTREAGVLLDAYTKDNDHVFSHELTHVISFGLIAHQPHWLSEGIATYFEMAELDPRSTSIRIGVPRDDRSRYLRAMPPLPISELFACHEHACMDGAFYATSWAVVSYLLNEHFDELSRYFQLLNTLPRERIDEAWRIAFPRLPPTRLDRELREWLLDGKVRLPTIDVAAVPDLPATDRPLADSDALAARSLLHLMFTQDLTATRALLDQALTADRTNVLARLVEAWLPRALPLDDARAVTEAHPDDWRAWWLLALTAHGAESRSAIDRMCTLTREEREQCAHPDQPPQVVP